MSVNAISTSTATGTQEEQYYKKVVDSEGNVSYVTVPIGQTASSLKEDNEQIIAALKKDLISPDKKTRKNAEDRLFDYYRQNGASRHEAKRLIKDDAAQANAVYRAQSDCAISVDESDSLTSDVKKERKAREDELQTEYTSALQKQGYDKKTAERMAKQYVQADKAALAQVSEDDARTAFQNLDSDDNNTRKAAEETVKAYYKNNLIAEDGYTEKEADKLASKLLKVTKAQKRFDSRTVFTDKEAYEQARNSDPEHKDNYVLLKGKSLDFVQNHPELFNDANDNFSSEKYKQWVYKEILQEEDYRAETAELDKAAETYGITRKTASKLTKASGADTEKVINKHLARFLYVAGCTAAGAGLGAGIGAAVNALTGTKVVTDISQYASEDVLVGTVSASATAISGTHISVDAGNAVMTGCTVTGAAGGLGYGLLTMNKINPKGAGDTTTAERQYIDLSRQTVPVDNDNNTDNDNTNNGGDIIILPATVEEYTCDYQKESNYEECCEFETPKYMTWDDFFPAAYGISRDDPNYAALRKEFKKRNGIPLNYTDIPKELYLYNLTVNGKTYKFDCDAQNKVKGTLTKAQMAPVRGRYNPYDRQDPQFLGYTSRIYRVGADGTRTLMDEQSGFHDENSIDDYQRRYAQEHNCPKTDN